MAQTRISEHWSRWAGTWPEFMAIVQLAEDEAGPSTRFGADVSFSKRTVSVAGIADLEGIVDAHNRVDVRGVRLELVGTKRTLVKISLGTSSDAATLQVIGEDTTFVEGLHARLAERLGRLAPWPGRVLGALLTVVLAVASYVTLVLLAARFGWLTFTGRDGSTGSAAAFLIIGTLLVVIIAAIASDWILPTLELPEEAGRHRMRRYRGVVVGLFVAVVVGLVTNALWDALLAAN